MNFVIILTNFINVFFLILDNIENFKTMLWNEISNNYLTIFCKFQKIIRKLENIKLNLLKFKSIIKNWKKIIIILFKKIFLVQIKFRNIRVCLNV